jgi:hypothetical protein
VDTLKGPIVDPQDAALLADLIGEQPVDAVPKQTTQTTTRRIRPSSQPSIYVKTQTSIALSFALAVAGLLWLAGAFFTLQALEKFGVKLAGIGIWQWFIPIAITASELALWPRRSSARLQFVFFLSVLLFDVGTSFAGLIQWGAGRTVPLFEGITLPSSGWGLRIVAGIIALIFAFGPERLARWAGPELWQLWK